MRDCNICSTSLGLMHCAYVVIQIDCMCLVLIDFTAPRNGC